MDWRFWKKQKRKAPDRRIGLVEQKPPMPAGVVFCCSGYVKGFPYRYTVRARTLRGGKVIEETAVANSQIVGEIFRMERRQLHQNAITALFLRGAPNYIVTIAAAGSKGAPIILLETEISIRSTYHYAPAVIVKICQAIKWQLENLYTDTQKLDSASKLALWGALRYPSPQTRQFWFSVIIQCYVGILKDR